MLKRILFGLASFALFSTSQIALAKEKYGEDATIVFAANGGIRDYQKGEPGVIYMQDRQLRWYRVTLTGDCIKGNDNAPLFFSTDSNGTFDTFSSISSRSAPNAKCGVVKIVTSKPPKSQPGADDSK